ncbi:hypothetical protein [Solobacterium sp.]|uniref:hypothetical protein n=1 Tax=Solobacterium sp. TaxID=2060878 RepID=UPI001CAC1CAD|nr:hypothetical protein [Solobacterium sp.]MBF1086570.1 hypothetical protein [Solobacterium sp.]
MEYIAKVTLYHNTKGLIKEGQTVELTKEEVAEYDKDYFNDLFEAVGAEETEETEDGEDKPKTKSKGKKTEEPAE